MKKIFLSIIFLPIFFFKSLYTQEIGFGLSFSPYSVETSTSNFQNSFDYIEKIITYFIETRQFNLSNFGVQISTFSYTKEQVDKIKNMFFGLGKSEIIRIFLICENSKKEAKLKQIVDLRKKGKTFKEISERYGIEDYLNTIWLESKKIYNEIFEDEISSSKSN